MATVDCKVCFMKTKYKVDEDVVVSVYIRCKSQFSLRFSQLELVFNDEVSLKTDFILAYIMGVDIFGVCVCACVSVSH